MPDALAGDRVTLGARVRDENTSTYYSRKAMSHSGGSSRSALGTLTNCSGVHMREQPNCKTPTRYVCHTRVEFSKYNVKCLSIRKSVDEGKVVCVCLAVNVMFYRIPI